jgi:ethanolamine ammonia-lyase large subunit
VFPLTGHKTRSVFERYNIVSECDLVEAAKKLNAMQPIGPTVRLKADTTYDTVRLKPNTTTTASKSTTFDRDGHNLGTVTRRSKSRLALSL